MKGCNHEVTIYHREQGKDMAKDYITCVRCNVTLDDLTDYKPLEQARAELGFDHGYYRKYKIYVRKEEPSELEAKVDGKSNL